MLVAVEAPSGSCAKGRALTKLAKRNSKKEKSHPWRMCPAGEHWVVTHPRHVTPSKKNPKGVTIVEGHCRDNPSRKDQIYPEEIQKIALKHFNKLKYLPVSDNLDRKKGNDYDKLIAGWTKFWNEVLKTDESLDLNLVKALVKTESEFKEKAKNRAGKRNWARGLMQLTDETIKILKDEKGELKDFLVNIDQNDANDPNLNICAGIRWLFHKKKLLEHKLHRKVSWEEAVMEYKSYTRDLKMGKNRAMEQRDKFLELYKRLQR